MSKVTIFLVLFLLLGSTIFPVSGLITNNPLINPPFGPTEGYIGIEYTFYFIIPVNLSSNRFLVNWIWGDLMTSGWLGPYSSGMTINASHAWSSIGSYDIAVILKDEMGNEAWSDVWTIQILPGPMLKINKISGFLWNIGTTISNVGLDNATNVNYTIFIQKGSSVNIFGQGIIPQIAPNNYEYVKEINRTISGISWFKIIIKVQCNNAAAVEKQVNALSFFSFIIYVKK